MRSVIAVGFFTIVAMMFLGASAQAEYTLLCPVAPEADECPEGEEHFREGTEITAKSTDLVLTLENVVFGVDGEVECDAELKVLTLESAGAPLLASEVTSFSVTNCIDTLSRECTATVATLPYGASLEADEASSGDGHIFVYPWEESGPEPGVASACKDSNPSTPDVDCTYTVDENDEQIGGGSLDLAKLDFDGAGEPSAVIVEGDLKEASGAECPGSNPTWSATFQITEPDPLFMASQIITTELCEEAVAKACATPYLGKTKYAGQLTKNNAVSFLYEYQKATKSFSCTDVWFSGEIGGAIGPELGAPMESLVFLSCSNECAAAVVNAPLDARFLATGGGNGRLWIGKNQAEGPQIAVSCKKDLCAYTAAALVGNVTGGGPAILTIGGKLPVKLPVSEKECGDALFMGGVTIAVPAFFEFTSPKLKGGGAAMWVSKG